MFDVWKCQACGETIENPPSIPYKCKCGSKDFELDLEESTGIPDEMVEKARPQVIEKRVEAVEVMEDFKPADNRGRVTLGSKYKNKNVKLAVLEVEE